MEKILIQLLFLVISVGVGSSSILKAASTKPSFKDFQNRGIVKHEKGNKGQHIGYYELLHAGKTFYATFDGEHITSKRQYIHSLLTHPGPHACSACDEVFSRSDVRDRHYNNKHLELRPHYCECGRAFKRSDHLQAHCKTQRHLPATGSSAPPQKSTVSLAPTKKRPAPVESDPEESDDDSDDDSIEEQLAGTPDQAQSDDRGETLAAPTRVSARLAMRRAAGRVVSFVEQPDSDDDGNGSDATISDSGRESGPFRGNIFPPVPSGPIALVEAATQFSSPLSPVPGQGTLAFDDLETLLFD